MIDLSSIVNGPNVVLSIVSGVIGGIYLATFHPTLPGRGALIRRSVLMGWWFLFLPSIYYIARIAFAIVGEQPDLARVVGGWILWFVFSISLPVGAFVGGLIRTRRYPAS